MTPSGASFSVRVDVTNPGHVFASCGLLEVAHRIWPGIEGWFSGSDRFALRSSGDGAALDQLMRRLSELDLCGLSEQERREREELEAQKRQLKKQRQSLPPDTEARRKRLGEQARGGSLQVGLSPASDHWDRLILDWWQREGETPKTWAGRQEVHRIARAAQDALAMIQELSALFEHACVLQAPHEYRRKAADGERSVEPFYFDARRFAHALDVGFSLDAVGAEVSAYPAVELLALVGLQRFRARPVAGKRQFEYWTWRQPLVAPVAAGVVSGAVPVPTRQRYRFALRFRDDQKRYKGFGWATAMGDEPHEQWIFRT